MAKWDEAMAQAEVTEGRKFVPDSQVVTTCSCGDDQSLQDARRVDDGSGKTSVYHCRSCGTTLMTVEQQLDGFLTTNAFDVRLIVDPAK